MSESERRRFSRISFSGQCSLKEEAEGSKVTHQTELLDISLNGALVKRPNNWLEKTDTLIELNLKLSNSDVSLEIKSLVCHQEETVLGIKFLTLNLDCITHLKRLIQLNIADENLMHREIAQLINLPE